MSAWRHALAVYMHLGLSKSTRKLSYSFYYMEKEMLFKFLIVSASPIVMMLLEVMIYWSTEIS